MDDAGKPDREGDVVGVDPAEIASEIHWNYALDVMKPGEISQVVSGAAATTTHDGLVEVSLPNLFPPAKMIYEWEWLADINQ